jgi:hypothetical protein
MTTQTETQAQWALGENAVELKFYALNGNLMEAQPHTLMATGNRFSGFCVTFNPYRQFMSEVEDFVKRQAWHTVADGRYAFNLVITHGGEDWRRAKVSVTVKKGQVAVGRVPTGFGCGTCWGSLITISEWK